ncbi:MAG: outer membrane protein assembly factor BamE domain-containing protein [Candidatus Marinarcus sp.]|uniref:outer membrane protein assembly factor BamE domain-containing protein n=1 Tax=Candidatus Marinarcus sp. TaxID=3100987 RepID=UPI003AFFF065
MIKKTLLIAGTMVLALNFTACTTTGTTKLENVSTADVKMKIVKGSSTMYDIVKLYGEPTSTRITDNNLDIWDYSFSSERESIPSYIPLVKSFSSGVKKVNKELVVYFNSQGIVDDYTFKSNHIESNTGLLH